jgi:hypothetical protein
MTGLVLILAGMALYFIKPLRGVPSFVVMTSLGGLLLAGYFYTARFGLLVSGCLLAGLGIGLLETGELWHAGNFRWLVLGIAFVAIWALGLLRERKSRWWPLVPGAILILLGFRALREARQFLFSRDGWPILFVIVGLLIVVASLGSRRRRAAG